MDLGEAGRKGLDGINVAGLSEYRNDYLGSIKMALLDLHMKDQERCSITVLGNVELSQSVTHIRYENYN
jgi:hypothetical protein